MRRLVTIPISHYCEKARWALDRAGLDYREERHVQGIHRFVSRRSDRRLFAIIGFTITGGKVVEMDILADPARLSRLDLSAIEG